MNKNTTQPKTVKSKPELLVEISVYGGVVSCDYIPPGVKVRVTDEDCHPAEVDTYEG